MRSKYGARRVETEDGVFDSQAEYRRWLELRLLAYAGVIQNLVRQPRFPIYAPELRVVVDTEEPPATLRLCKGKDGAPCIGRRVGYYSADFIYEQDGSIVVEDVKSRPTRTEAYRLRKKLVEATYQVKIVEVEM